MKKSKIITLISVFVICCSLLATLFLNNDIASRIAEIVTIITAVIGAVALFFQFQRDKGVNEASFLLEFWKSFSENPKLIVIQRKCDADMYSDKTTFTDEDYDGILTYAEWLEALCAVINKEVISLDFISDMYSYIFFVFVNNKYVQEKELVSSAEFYEGIIKAYNTWVKYLKKHKKKVLLEENSLIKALEQKNINSK